MYSIIKEKKEDSQATPITSLTAA